VAVGSIASLILAVEYEALIRSYKEEKIMRDRLQTRLQELKKEFDTGQAHLQELEKQQVYLRETMLRISGAIQVLEELLAQEHPVEHHMVDSSETQPSPDQVHPVTLIDTALQTPYQEEYNHRPSQDGAAIDVKIGKE
jgi:predicted nuclease with TOPRIM domain